MTYMSADWSVWLRNQFYNRLVGNILPVSWFAPLAPRPDSLNVPGGRLHLQIVSHCWQYAHLARFQLSSLCNYPPEHCEITYTLFHADEDHDLKRLIEQFDRQSIPNIQWDWQVLPKDRLFRRAIGRHQAALQSQADWIWYSDCDLIFHQGCLDSLVASLEDEGRLRRTGLVFPDHESITDLLPAEHPVLNQQPDYNGRIDIDPSLFRYNAITKAKGAFQIVHGDVARQAGYCGSIALYQQPTDAWRKTYEDTVFRRLIEYEGVPVPVDNLYRIRHAEKGRYRKDSPVSRIRQNLRLRQG